MASSPHSSSHLYLLLVLFPLLAAATTLPVTSEFELGIQKRIHFRVYFHETFLGPDNTTVTVVNMSLPYTFGDVDIFDAVLRIGLSKWSTEVGRAQGVSFHVSQRDESSLIPLVLVLVFTAGNFCDSTLTVIGRIDASGKADRAIVGGTGVFQFASGNVVSKQVTSDVAGLVVAFEVYVMYHNDVRLTSIA
ncbi:dirigent protein 1-like [Musa acuminata AAA Group]|uniref:dirigent protein 1-like n=1 Tax=Musa acuminata AAA Group TaxID=214697 RepID=UPI0031D6586D